MNPTICIVDDTPLRRAAGLLASAGLLDCLDTRPTPPEPSHRVPGVCICGKTISQNKPLCKACNDHFEMQIAAQRLARHITDEAMLQQVLADAGGRAHLIMEAIRPYLKVELAPAAGEIERMADDGCPHDVTVQA